MSAMCLYVQNETMRRTLGMDGVASYDAEVFGSAKSAHRFWRLKGSREKICNFAISRVCVGRRIEVQDRYLTK